MIWLLYISLSFATGLLEETLGIVGRGVDPLPDAMVAYQLSDDQKWEKAAQAWESYGKSNPEFISDARLWEVTCLIKSKDYGRAVSHMRIGTFGEDVDIRLGLLMALIELESGHPKGAYKLASLYPMHAPDAEGAQILQLRSLLESGKTRKNSRLKRNLMDAGNTDAWFWYELGIEALGNNDPSTHYFEQAISMDNSSAIHYRYLLQSLGNEDTSAVLRYSLEAVKRFPEDSFLQNRIQGYAEDDQLVDSFQDFADASPEYGELQWLTGFLLQAREGYVQSARYFRASIDAGNDSPRIYRQLIDNLQQMGESHKAYDILIEAVSRHPTNDDMLEMLIDQSAEPESQRVALEFLEDIWRTHQEKNVAHHGFSLSRKLLSWSDALIWAKREALLAPKVVTPIIHQGIALQQLKEWEALIELYEEGLFLHPNSHLLLNNLAWTYTQKESSMEQLLNALQLANRAIDLTDGKRAAYFDTLAQIWWKLGEYAEAEKAMESAIRLMPDNLLYQSRLEQYKQ
jgi:tetratricopeptide (TPR) repeat protein